MGFFCLELGKTTLFSIGNGAEFRPQNRVIESPVLNVPMWDGGQRLQCKSELAQCSEKNNRALVRRMGGAGLKFEEKKCWNNNKVHN